MNARRGPFPTIPSSQHNLCALRHPRQNRCVGVYPELIGALSSSDLFLSPFNLELPAKRRVEAPASFPFARHSPLTTRHFCANHETLLSLSPLLSALPGFAPLTPLESALPKTQDLKSFRIRTYRKRRGEGVLLLTASAAGHVHLVGARYIVPFLVWPLRLSTVDCRLSLVLCPLTLRQHQHRIAPRFRSDVLRNFVEESIQ